MADAGAAPAGTRRAAGARAPELQAMLDEAEAAREDPRRVIHLLAEYPDDDDVDALLLGADALITLGKLDHAMEALTEAERLAPGHPEAARGVARVALLRTAGHIARPRSPAPKGRAGAHEPAIGRARSRAARRARVAAVAFALAGVLALAGAAFSVVTGGPFATAAWGLSGTGLVAGAVAAGLVKRAPLAWWGGAGFAGGAAVVAVTAAVLGVLSAGVAVRPLALPLGTLLVAGGLAALLWRSRDAAGT